MPHAIAQACFRSWYADVNGMRLNERAAVQQGAFLCPGNVTQPLEDNLKRLKGFDNPENLVKIIILGKLRSEALERLHAMNINKAAPIAHR